MIGPKGAEVERMTEELQYMTGRKVAGKCDFFLGAADNPVDPPPGWQPAWGRL